MNENQEVLTQSCVFHAQQTRCDWLNRLCS